MEPSNPILEFSEVSIATHFKRASFHLEGVNWQVSTGDFWVVGGLPGTGKTALTHTAAGLEFPAAGHVSLFGKRLDGLSEVDLEAVRLKIGLVFAQSGRLFHQLSVLENIALPVCYRNNWPVSDAAPSLQPLIQAAGLEPFLHVTPGQLTLIWQRRVALVRAMALKPQLLLLDNPSGGLPRSEISWLLEFLKQAWEGSLPGEWGRATIVVTADDFDPWRGTATHFSLLQQQKWIALGGRETAEKSAEPVARELWRHNL